MSANSYAVNRGLMEQVFAAAEKKDWSMAHSLARQVSKPSARVLVEWMELRDGVEDWSRYARFLEKHGDWPGLKRLRRKGEDAIPTNVSLAELNSYFEMVAPQTATGAILLAKNLSGAEQEKRLQEIWATMSLTAEQEAALLKDHSGILAQVHDERADALLWQGWTDQAERLLPRLDPGYRALTRARIGLQKKANGVDGLIGAVPAALKSHPGLNFDRFQWRIAKGRWEDAQAFIAEMDGVDKMGRPEEWSNRRRGFARRAMREGKSETAYGIAVNHGQEDGSHYADLEWLAGYIALSKLNRASDGLTHFQNMLAAVRSPISLGRGYYWIGRAENALGNSEAAQIAFAEAAKYQTGFYGQLGAAEAGVSTDPFIAADAQVSWKDGDFLKSTVLEAAYLYHLVGDEPRMRWFLTHMAETLSVAETAKLSHYARDLGHPYVALGIAKEAVKRDFILPDVYFPVTDLARKAGKVPRELALSIARRESEFRHNAKSGAGALGLMQVMPATGRQVAGEIGIEYSKSKLQNNADYNAQIGTHYLASLLDEYEGSYVLAFAAYNAGPGRVNQWLQEYGDPRKSSVNVIDWIEHIPFRETRNYVMRVMEGVHVYRARLGIGTGTVEIKKDLNR